MPLVLTPAQYRKLQETARCGQALPKLATLPSAKAKARGPRHSEMTREERLYEGYLEAEKIAGNVLWYEFEAIKLRLVQHNESQPDGSIKRHSVYYTPDFAVLRASLALEFVEVKGTTTKQNDKGVRREMPFVKDDAAVKLAVD